MATVAERVAAGVAWLDAKAPGWIDRVDLDELQMASTCSCVLGQLFHGYYYAPITLGEAMLCGFDTELDVEDAESAARASKEFVALTDEWRRVITERRESVPAAV